MPHFGHPPLAAHLPLKAGQNLADVPNKATARTNLDVFSKTETLLHGVPVGTIISFYGTVAPPGYLPCHGQTVVATTYPELVQFLNPGKSSAVIPDLRGEFLRGLDQGRGVDTGRGLGTSQRGTITIQDPSPSTFGIGTPIGASEFTPTTFGSEGGFDIVPESYFANIRRAEYLPTTGTPKPLTSLDWAFGVSRPRNIAVMYCIKAYGAINNVGTVDVGKVLSELSDTVKLSEFGKSLTTNGYQKISGGLIIQWGTVNFTSDEQLHLNGKVVSFPISFPNTCLSICSEVVSSADTRVETSTASRINASTFRYYAYVIGNATAYKIESYTGSGTWIAIGY